jgi:hypothetical protein
MFHTSVSSTSHSSASSLSTSFSSLKVVGSNGCLIPERFRVGFRFVVDTGARFGVLVRRFFDRFEPECVEAFRADRLAVDCFAYVRPDPCRFHRFSSRSPHPLGGINPRSRSRSIRASIAASSRSDIRRRFRDATKCGAEPPACESVAAQPHSIVALRGAGLQLRRPLLRGFPHANRVDAFALVLDFGAIELNGFAFPFVGIVTEQVSKL